MTWSSFRFRSANLYRIHKTVSSLIKRLCVCFIGICKNRYGKQGSRTSAACVCLLCHRYTFPSFLPGFHIAFCRKQCLSLSSICCLLLRCITTVKLYLGKERRHVGVYYSYTYSWTRDCVEWSASGYGRCITKKDASRPPSPIKKKSE